MDLKRRLRVVMSVRPLPVQLDDRTNLFHRFFE